MIVPFLFFIRRSLEETEEFQARKHRPTIGEVFSSLGRNWRIVLLGMLLVGDDHDLASTRSPCTRRPSARPC